MKSNWRNNIVLFAIISFSILMLASCGKKDKETAGSDSYTCPMHPTVMSDHPGSCPICGMDLVMKARSGEQVETTQDIASLGKSPNETVVASIKTINGKYKKVGIAIQAQGVVTYDTRNIYTISSRIGGRLEKVFLKYAFQQVTKGQKIAAIYSPDLIIAQRELLFLLENDADNAEVIASSKERLSLLGASTSQIDALIKRKEVKNTFTIYSPFDGYIITNDQQTPAAPITLQSDGGMGGMSTSNSSNTNVVESNNSEATVIREGTYVSSGQTLFKVVDTKALRIELNIPSSQGTTIKKGNKVELDLGVGSKQTAIVDFVQPFFNDGEDFIKVRIYINDRKMFHIGQLTSAVINLDSAEGLWIPKEAVLDLGLDKVVFIKDGDVLKPRKVTTGIQSLGWIEIKQGLSSSEGIASNAQFLVDSESFIKTQQ